MTANLAELPMSEANETEDIHRATPLLSSAKRVETPCCEQIRLLVQMIVKCVVEDGENVSVIGVDGAESTLIVVEVAERNIGRIIGSKGAMARSIRTVLSAVSSKTGHRFQLEIKS